MPVIQSTEQWPMSALEIAFFAFRRSELSDLTCGDTNLHRLDGLHVRLCKTKTDQEGRGAVRALPFTDTHQTCPPCAYVR